jgi:hypothetical protein
MIARETVKARDEVHEEPDLRGAGLQRAERTERERHQENREASDLGRSFDEAEEQRVSEERDREDASEHAARLSAFLVV